MTEGGRKGGREGRREGGTEGGGGTEAERQRQTEGSNQRGREAVRVRDSNKIQRYRRVSRVTCRQRGRQTDRKTGDISQAVGLR